MAILVCGGAGYIGTHTCIELLNHNYDIIVADNLSNSCEEALRRVKKITQKDFRFFKTELCDLQAVRDLFSQNPDIEAVIHFAALKAVGESVSKPLEYYDNNLTSTLVLLKVMKENKVNNLVFSSSATVYGDPASLPIREDFPLSATNPYGQTKLMIESILTDIQKAMPKMNIALLRYFNPVGAHASGLIGEDPKGIPNNLLPYISQVAVGKLSSVNIYGNDYDTPDGTGVRDYIHVVDLARGHVAALNKLFSDSGLVVYNLGTGQGYSVLDMIHAYEKASNKTIPYQITARRPGDIAACYADPSKAKEELGWQAKHALEDMCRDSWRWQSANPEGYPDTEHS